MANIRPLLVTFSGQLYPVTTQYFAQKDTDRIRALFLSGSRFTVLLAIPVAIFFGMYGRQVMQLWLGAVLTPAEIILAGKVLAGWAMIELAVSLEGSAWAVLFGMRRVRFIIAIELIASLCNLAASLYLITETKLGIMAVVYPSIFLEAIIRPVYALYAARKIGVKPVQVLTQVYLRPTIVGLLLLAFSYLLIYLFPSLKSGGLY
jgi:O-antigen/teichoic acid export membrane protein